MDTVIKNLEFINDLSDKNYWKLVTYIKSYLSFYNDNYLESGDRNNLIEKMYDFLLFFYSAFQKSNNKGSFIFSNSKNKINNLASYLQVQLYNLLNTLNIFEESTKKNPIMTEYKYKCDETAYNICKKDGTMYVYSINSVLEFVRLMNCAINSYLKCKTKVRDENFIFDYNEEISDKVMNYVLSANDKEVNENDYYDGARFASIMYIFFSIVLLDRLEKEGVYD